LEGRPDWHWSGNDRNWRNALNLWNHLCASGEIPNQTQQDKPQAPGMSVTVAPVETTRVARTLNTTGTVAAVSSLPYCPRQRACKSSNVEEGDVVKTGQVMAVLDNSVYRRNLTRRGRRWNQTKPRCNKDKQLKRVPLRS